MASILHIKLAYKLDGDISRGANHLNGGISKRVLVFVTTVSIMRVRLRSLETPS
jgi:hypothetical protein